MKILEACDKFYLSNFMKRFSLSGRKIVINTHRSKMCQDNLRLSEKDELLSTGREALSSNGV